MRRNFGYAKLIRILRLIAYLEN